MFFKHCYCTCLNCFHWKLVPYTHHPLSENVAPKVVIQYFLLMYSPYSFHDLIHLYKVRLQVALLYFPIEVPNDLRWTPNGIDVWMNIESIEDCQIQTLCSFVTGCLQNNLGNSVALQCCKTCLSRSFKFVRQYSVSSKVKVEGKFDRFWSLYFKFSICLCPLEE